MEDDLQTRRRAALAHPSLQCNTDTMSDDDKPRSTIFDTKTMYVETVRVDYTVEPFCALDEIEDGQARSFETLIVDGVYSVIVARRGDAVYGYANSCPHLGTPLDWAPDKFMDFSGRYLRCATHGATFEVETGFCISGPCEDETLRGIALELRSGRVYLAPGQ